MIKIPAFAGSTRTESFNKKLVAIAAQGARDEGADVTLLNLRDFPMPIFDQDFEAEQGIPEMARQFKQHLIETDGLLISSPEYNSGYSALLKNCMDWASRAESSDEESLSAFSGKCASIMATSPGGLGGICGLVSLRMLLGNLGVTVLPGQVVISKAYTAFNKEGILEDSKQQDAIKTLARVLVETLNKLKG